jgi:hypothetical protein
MDTHTATEPGPTDDGPEAPPQAETKLLAPPRPEVSDEDFGVVVSGALEAVGGALLFKVRAGSGDEAMHVAAAAVGAGDARQFLLLSLPIHGGQLKVETAQRSSNPLAGIAASYACLMDAFHAAA